MKRCHAIRSYSIDPYISIKFYTTLREYSPAPHKRVKMTIPICSNNRLHCPSRKIVDANKKIYDNGEREDVNGNSNVVFEEYLQVRTEDVCLHDKYNIYANKVGQYHYTQASKLTNNEPNENISHTQINSSSFNIITTPTDNDNLLFTSIPAASSTDAQTRQYQPIIISDSESILISDHDSLTLHYDQSSSLQWSPILEEGGRITLSSISISKRSIDRILKDPRPIDESLNTLFLRRPYLQDHCQDIRRVFDHYLNTRKSV